MCNFGGESEENGFALASPIVPLPIMTLRYGDRHVRGRGAAGLTQSLYPEYMTKGVAIIVSSGNDPSLLSTRTLVLKEAGFQVIPLPPEQVVLTVREREDIQGALLCHSIDVDDRVELAQQLREVSPRIAIVMMRRPNESFDASDIDSVVECLPRPEILVAAVRRALKKQQS